MSHSKSGWNTTAASLIDTAHVQWHCTCREKAMTHSMATVIVCLLIVYVSRHTEQGVWLRAFYQALNPVSIG